MKQILNDVMIIKLSLWVATFGIGFNGAENDCEIAHILGPTPPGGGGSRHPTDEQLRLLDISSSNNLPSVLVESKY